MKSIVIYKRVFIVLLILLISACATPYRIPMTENVTNNISSTDVAVGLSRNSIRVHYVASNSSASSAQFGLLGALIGAVVDTAITTSREEDAEKLAAPIRKVTADYNFSQEFSNALNSELNSVEWIKANNSMVVTNYKAKDGVSGISGNTGDAILVVHPDFYISPDTKTFNISCNIALHANTNEALKKMAKPESSDDDPKVLYRNIVRYQISLPKAPESEDEGVSMWVADDGKSIKMALQQGVELVTKMIRIDLADVKSKKQAAEPESETDKELDKGDNYTIYRQPGGSLISYGII